MSSAAKIGVFMIIILAILGYFVLKIEDIDVRGKDKKQVRVVFENAAGLDEQAAVRVAGVRKGKVKTVDMEANGQAGVLLEIDEDVPLFANASARIASLGLLGETYVEIDPGTPGTPLKTGDVITLPGTQTASINDVTAQVSDIARDVKAITESMRTVMSGPTGQQRLEDIVENVRLITAQTRELLAANRENVDATMTNMRLITADLRNEIPKLVASIDRAANSIGNTVGENRTDVRQLVDNLRTLSANLKTTTDNLNNITGQVRSGEGTMGKLFYSDEAHERLTAALGSVESGVGELRDTLGRVSRIQMDLGIKADYYAGMQPAGEELDDIAGNSRTAVSVRLRPNPERNRFYNIELSDDPRGNRSDEVKVETITDSATGITRTITTRERKFERDYVISAQAGWLLDNIGLRVGLFDSAGGVGADYRFNDRLTVTGEAFDFAGRRDDNPHIRVFGEYTFRREKPESPRMFLTSGVDNALNDTAIIFGGGIRWRDEDLKYLMGSIPLGR